VSKASTSAHSRLSQIGRQAAQLLSSRVTGQSCSEWSLSALKRAESTHHADKTRGRCTNALPNSPTESSIGKSLSKAFPTALTCVTGIIREALLVGFKPTAQLSHGVLELLFILCRTETGSWVYRDLRLNVCDSSRSVRQCFLKRRQTSTVFIWPKTR
jgi:hypothetical protein